MFPTPPGGSNTVSNSSTVNGWLESTGLDDILRSTCSCFVEEDEQTSPPAQDKEGQKAGAAAEGKPQIKQPILGARQRYVTFWKYVYFSFFIKAQQHNNHN